VKRAIQHTDVPGHFTGTFVLIFRRELGLLVRNRSEIANPLFFFVIIASLFPLSMSSEKAMMAAVGPGVIWVSAVLAIMMGLGSTFRSDREDGSLEQLLLSPRYLPVIALAKVAANWFATALPIVLASPFIAIAMRLSPEQIGILLLGLALGTPTLCLIGAVGVALTVGLQRGGLLLAILILPLYTPILIFGAGMVGNVAAAVPVTGQLYLLAALLVLALTLTPFAISAALRATID
jgi:heme exporter protein B